MSAAGDEDDFVDRIAFEKASAAPKAKITIVDEPDDDAGVVIEGALARKRSLATMSERAPAREPAREYNEVQLRALNDQHAVIDIVGGKKTVIASFETVKMRFGEEMVTRHVIAYQRPADFLLRYSNRKVWVEVPNKQGGVNREQVLMAKWWLAHPQRRQHRGVLFLPGEPKLVDGCLNLWRGWGVLAVQGDWSLIRKHIFEVIAGGNAEFAEYVIRWIAWAFQNPGWQAEVALVLIGEKGAGKGSLIRCLQRIFDAHAFQAQCADHVIGRFNAHFQDCVLFVVDEAYWGTDYKKCVGRLQGFITEPTIPIEPKGVDVIQAPNCLHVVMLAEPGWVIPAGRHERRYAALKVSDARLQDRAYFTALHRQIAEGGAEAMFYDLQAMDLEGWHPRELPESLLSSEALQEQQIRSLPDLEAWYLGLLHAAALPDAVPKHSNWTRAESLLQDAHGKFPRLALNLSIRGVTDFIKDKERIGTACELKETSAFNVWMFPPLAECRAAWERLYGPTEWERRASEWGGGSSNAHSEAPALPRPVVTLRKPEASAPPSAPSPPAALGLYLRNRLGGGSGG